jgi:hypothetical protein
LRRTIELVGESVLKEKAVAALVEQVFVHRRAAAIAMPALDEDPNLPLGKALRVMASRGSEAAQRELDLASIRWGLR